MNKGNLLFGVILTVTLTLNACAMEESSSGSMYNEDESQLYSEEVNLKLKKLDRKHKGSIPLTEFKNKSTSEDSEDYDYESHRFIQDFRKRSKSDSCDRIKKNEDANVKVLSDDESKGEEVDDLLSELGDIEGIRIAKEDDLRYFGTDSYNEDKDKSEKVSMTIGNINNSLVSTNSEEYEESVESVDDSEEDNKNKEKSENSEKDSYAEIKEDLDNEVRNSSSLIDSEESSDSEDTESKENNKEESDSDTDESSSFDRKEGIEDSGMFSDNEMDVSTSQDISKLDSDEYNFHSAVASNKEILCDEKDKSFIEKHYKKIATCIIVPIISYGIVKLIYRYSDRIFMTNK